MVPLPDDPRTVWPPKEVDYPNEAFQTWQAWYSGKPAELAAVYENYIGYAPNPLARIPASLIQRRERWFWGRRLGPNPDLSDARLHVPLAGDIAAVSADLLFAEPPQLSVEGEDGGPSGAGAKPTTERLNMLMGDGGFLPVLIEAAEIASNCSGVYLRASWVDDVADHVLIDAITPDHAVPEWRAGRLSAVTFWRVVADDNGRIWRHLERHEAANGVGIILHGLYVGNGDQLGTQVDLAAHPSTAPLAEGSYDVIDGLTRQVVTGAARIAVEFVPNLRPPRRLRGTPYGRSDLDGIEPTLDAIDEVWSSWMRDIRIGKGRIIVPQEYLYNRGRGQGAVFDAEQAVYEAVEALPSSEGITMQPVQFQIRVSEHRDTIAELVGAALGGAGYSVQTFGGSGDVAATATEVVARERRSFTTRGRKILYWRPALARLLETALQIDVAHFRPDKVQAVRPQVGFPDGVARDPLNVAQSLALIAGAEAASLFTRVKMVNPDWSNPMVLEEVDRIRQDARVMMQINTPPVPVPGTLDGNAAGGQQPGQADHTAAASGGGAAGGAPGGGAVQQDQTAPGPSTAPNSAFTRAKP